MFSSLDGVSQHACQFPYFQDPCTHRCTPWDCMQKYPKVLENVQDSQKKCKNDEYVIFKSNHNVLWIEVTYPLRDKYVVRALQILFVEQQFSHPKSPFPIGGSELHSAGEWFCYHFCWGISWKLTFLFRRCNICHRCSILMDSLGIKFPTRNDYWLAE